MKQITVISGKGGTGKTSLVGAFAAISENMLLVDCDVDAADLHLLLDPKMEQREDFFAGYEADFDPEKCTGCGKCVEHCRFNAVALVDGCAEFDLISCEGCGVCEDVCPVDAVRMVECRAGESYRSKTRFGTLFHARLGPGGDMSGKLVASLRMKAEEFARANGIEIILVDGSPGIGCPVIASLSGVDAALVVAEPTLSGLHDMGRVLELCAHFKVRTSVLINKCDINPEISDRIRDAAEKAGATVVGKVPFDKTFTKSMMEGRTVVEYAGGELAAGIRKIWKNVLAGAE